MAGEPGLRIAIGQFNVLDDEKLIYAQQLGVPGVQMNTPKLPEHDGAWAYEDLLALRTKTEGYGLRFEAIENVPIHFYDKAMLGLPGREEQIAKYQETIRNVGRAGIPILGYHFMPNSVWRTTRTGPGRGGAHVTAFDMALVETVPGGGQSAFVAKRDEKVDALWVKEELSGDVVDEAAMWANYEYFMRAVLPTAAEAGVKLALHPDDPPVPMLGGVARLFKDVAGFKRAEQIALDAVGGEAWGLDLCLGCCSEMPGGATNVRAMIEHFGPAGRILYIHFRDVKGTVPSFAECFIGEGNYNPAEIMLLLQRVGFTGFLLDDHVPHMIDDSTWQHRGRAHAIGYMQGLIEMAAARG